MDPRRGRHRHRRDHRPCAAPARRHRFRRSAAEAGKALDKGGEAAVVELVKAASDVYAPASGEVIEANPAIADDPSLINTRPRRRGLVLQAHARRPGRARRPDGRGRLSRLGRRRSDRRRPPRPPVGCGGLCPRRRLRARAGRRRARPARAAAGRAHPRCRLRRRHADAADQGARAPRWSGSTAA